MISISESFPFGALASVSTANYLVILGHSPQVNTTTLLEQTDFSVSSVIFSHQVGHDVMVAFDVFPDADNLQGGGAELNVNLTGLQHIAC